MDNRLRALTRDLTYRPGASDEAIAALLQSMQKLALPLDYLEFMRATNGAEGMVGRHYLALTPIEEIARRNDELKVDQFAPGLVIFADNGADTAYAFDTRSAGPCIVNVPRVGMSLEDSTSMAPTFTGFLEILSNE